MRWLNVIVDVWTQGDFVRINPLTKGIVITGRRWSIWVQPFERSLANTRLSDGVLNPAGVRFGSSEIYAVLSTLPSIIADYIVVGQRRSNDLDEQVLLFVEMVPGIKCDRSIQFEIQRQISQALSTRHVPKYIIPVPCIPYNVNGKRLETLVKRVVSGGEVDDRIRSTFIHEHDLDTFRKFSKDDELEPYRLLRSSKLWSLSYKSL